MIEPEQKVYEYIKNGSMGGEETTRSLNEIRHRIEKCTGERLSLNIVKSVVIKKCKNIHYREKDKIMFPFTLTLSPLSPTPLIHSLTILGIPSFDSGLIFKPFYFVKEIDVFKNEMERIMQENNSKNNNALNYIVETQDQKKPIAFLSLCGIDNFSPDLLEVFEKRKGYGRKIVCVLEKLNYGRTMKIYSLRSSFKFWFKIGFQQDWTGNKITWSQLNSKDNVGYHLSKACNL